MRLLHSHRRRSIYTDSGTTADFGTHRVMETLARVMAVRLGQWPNGSSVSRTLPMKLLEHRIYRHHDRSVVTDNCEEL